MSSAPDLPLHPDFRPRLAMRRAAGTIFAALCLGFSLIAVIVLGTLLIAVWNQGVEFLSVHFLTAQPSQLTPENSGIRPALIGSILITLITALVAVPLGLGAAVFLEEYARDHWITRIIRLNISNLAGVPSVVYGLLGLAVFVRWFELDRSLLAAGLTLTLLVLPVIVIASTEAIAAVPRSIRMGAYALGATRSQAVFHHVLPAALPGVMTGIILALSRAIGESAPLIIVGVAAFSSGSTGGGEVRGLGDVWNWLLNTFTGRFEALPVQVYTWIDEPEPVFHKLAAAAIIVLLGVLLSLNTLAIILRARRQSRSSA